MTVKQDYQMMIKTALELKQAKKRIAQLEREVERLRAELDEAKQNDTE